MIERIWRGYNHGNHCKAYLKKVFIHEERLRETHEKVQRGEQVSWRSLDWPPKHKKRYGLREFFG
jgi:hypothetical protein